MIKEKINYNHYQRIASECCIEERQVHAAAKLLDEGATIPFISRYRKEATGSLDEVAVGRIRDRLEQLRELEKRKESILKSLLTREILTEDLQRKILAAETLTILEDIYLPYKPKKRTKATVARERGLEPLAKKVFEQRPFDIVSEATKYVKKERQVNDLEVAIQGAQDIIAEWINENPKVRAYLREFTFTTGIFKSKVIPGKETKGEKYKDYFTWEEKIKTIPSHRVLAMRRGENDGVLSITIHVNDDEALSGIEALIIKRSNAVSDLVRVAIKDSYKRLLSPSIQSHIRSVTKRKADEEAIRVFAENLRQLLLAAPLGQKNVLAIDPGFRTGCKVVCLDKQGKLLEHTAVFPHEPQKKIVEATEIIQKLVEKHSVETIAIGNGTAGRETENFIRNIGLPSNTMVSMMNESGASVYSASAVAREEFPDHDVTVRGAVSIGRRLVDPLAELVKIDPKSIGVGQYQHDVDQTALKLSLDDVVMSCVNRVGVEVNTASKQLLSYVSGLGQQLALKIVEYRNTHGPFRNRQELKNVPRLGERAFQQAAGFLRIQNSDNPLDHSAVHPESYAVVRRMAQTIDCGIPDLIRDPALRKRVRLQDFVTETIGLPTLNDIMEELAKPGRDPRDTFEVFSFPDEINTMKDLRSGMKLPGIVTNITNFGAFVDIGVHRDGLVHISQLADRFVSNPSAVVNVHQKVTVTVLGIDISRKRIQLSMKENVEMQIQKQ